MENVTKKVMASINESNKRKKISMNKHKWIQPYNLAFGILLLFLIICSFLLPETGTLALLDEACDVLILWLVCIYVILFLIKKKKIQKKIQVLLIVLCLIVGCFLFHGILLDLITGAIQNELYDIQVRQSQGPTGIFSHHYYITGKNEEQDTLQFEISAQDFSNLSNAHHIALTYYEHTDRIVEIRILS